MHRKAFMATEKMVARIPEGFIAAADVVELGSCNVNGTIRPLFREARSYLGVDVRPGPDVDLVDDATYHGADASYDIVVSCEMLEHAPHPKAIIRNCYRILRPGGYLLLTAASEHRAPHGNDGMEVHEGEHYGGIRRDDLEVWASGFFAEVTVSEDVKAGDVYLFARKGR